MQLRNSLIAAMLISAVACMPRGPVLDTGSKPRGVGGTIAGVVRASPGDAPLSGRKVTAIEVVSGARHETSTAINGGYTMKVPVGKYRLEVELRPGESIASQPPETDVNASDMDAGRDFVITTSRQDHRDG